MVPIFTRRAGMLVLAMFAAGCTLPATITYDGAPGTDGTADARDASGVDVDAQADIGNEVLAADVPDGADAVSTDVAGDVPVAEDVLDTADSIQGMDVTDVTSDVLDVLDAATSDAADATDVGPICGDAQTLCSGSCVDLSTDPANCGACQSSCSYLCSAGSCCGDFQQACCAGRPCRTGSACDNGICVQCGGMNQMCCPGGICATGSACINSTCTACGVAGQSCCPNNLCGTGNMCVSGTCMPCGGPAQPCCPGQMMCSGTCVDLTSDPNNCGACGTLCGQASNANTACVGGICQITTCTNGYLDCDGLVGDGCEVNGMSDLYNCGACHSYCGTANTTGAVGCTNGQCTGTCVSPGTQSYRMHANGVANPQAGTYWDCTGLGTDWSVQKATDACIAATGAPPQCSLACASAAECGTDNMNFYCWGFVGSGTGLVATSSSPGPCPTGAMGEAFWF